jgi:hypothetical protein
MALIFRGKSKCALCGQVIEVDDVIVATSHFIADKSDSLWRYSDAPFHKRCFLAWERRHEFVSRYNHTMMGCRFGNGTRHHMDDEGNIHMVPADEFRGTQPLSGLENQ